MQTGTGEDEWWGKFMFDDWEMGRVITLRVKGANGVDAQVKPTSPHHARVIGTDTRGGGQLQQIRLMQKSGEEQCGTWGQDSDYDYRCFSFHAPLSYEGIDAPWETFNDGMSTLRAIEWQRDRQRRISYHIEVRTLSC